MNKEIVLPEGWIIDKIENGKIFLKEEEKKLPESWEEWVEQNPAYHDGEYYINSRSKVIKYCPGVARDACENSIQSEEHARAILSLIKLLRLRDTYRQGWKPDWKDFYQNKYNITYESANKFAVRITCVESYIFSFQSMEIAELFLKNFESELKSLDILFK